jgi:imidazolonepropionase-like amidohydrolase
MTYHCSVIPRRLLPALLLPLCACAPGDDSRTKAFLGAMLLDGSGGPPLSNSIVVTGGGRIRAAGAQSSVPVPAEADRIDGSGKVLVPALVDVRDRAEPAALVRASSPSDARRAVESLTGSHPTVLYLDEAPRETAEAVLEAARAAGIPVLARAPTQVSAAFLVDHGVSGLIGMIADTEALDPALLSRLRDLKITVAPALLHAGAALETAKHNTLRMFRAGVPIAAASEGGDLQRELELLADAGIPPLDVLVAATRNGALALHQPERGTIEAGKRADLLLLSANPGADIANLRQVALRLNSGEWVR